MSCVDVRPFLGAHLDHELDARTSLEVETHLRACAACRAEIAELRALGEGARAHLTRFAPSAGLEARLAAAIGAPRPRRRRWIATAGAALAMAATVVLFLQSPAGPDRRLAGDIADAHTRSLLVDHLTDVASTDQHTVKPWFNGKVGFGVPVSDFAAAGFPLVGGRLDYVAGRDVAALVYHRRTHVINVFLWPESSDAEPRELRTRGYAVLHFAHAGLSFWLVSDASPDDLRELQRLLANSP